MIASVAAWIASKLFFGGNKSALNVVPAIVIAVVVTVCAYYTGRGVQAIKSRADLKAMTSERDGATARADSVEAEYKAAIRASEDAHTAALIAMDAAHQAELQRQSDAITKARLAASEATQRFDALNNQLVRIHNEAPAVACDIPPDRLSVLEAAAAAANSARTDPASPSPTGHR